MEHQVSFPEKAIELATTLWPPDATNYWFPNWKELFHGFSVVQSLKVSQTHYESDFEQRRRTLYCEPQNSGSVTHCPDNESCHMGLQNTSTINRLASSFQQSRQGLLHAESLKPTQGLMPVSVSPHNAAMLSSQREATDSKQIEEKIVYFKHLTCGHRICSKKDVKQFPRASKRRATKRNMTDQVLTDFASNSLSNTFAHKKICIVERNRPSAQSPVENEHSSQQTTSMTKEFSELGLHKVPAPLREQLDSLRTDDSIEEPIATEKAHKLSMTMHAELSNLNITEDAQTTMLWQRLEKRDIELSIPEVVTDGPATRNVNDSNSGTTRSDGGNQKKEALQGAHNEMVQITGVKELEPPLKTERKMASISTVADQAFQLTKELQSTKSEGIQIHRVIEVAATSMKDLTIKRGAADRADQLRQEIEAAHDEVVRMSMGVQEATEKLSRDISDAKKNFEHGKNMKALHVETGSSAEAEYRSEIKIHCEPKIDSLSTFLTTTSIGGPAYNGSGVPTTLLDPAPAFTFGNCFAECWLPDYNHMSAITNYGQRWLQTALCIPAAFSIAPFQTNQLTKIPNMTIHTTLRPVIATDAAKKSGAMADVRSPAKKFDDTNGSGKTHPTGKFQANSLPARAFPFRTKNALVPNLHATKHAPLLADPTSATQQTLQIPNMSLARATEADYSRDLLCSEPTQHDCDLPAKRLVMGLDDLRSTLIGKQTHRDGEADDVQAAKRQKQWKDRFSKVSAAWSGKRVLSNPLLVSAGHIDTKDCAGEPNNLILAAHPSAACTAMGFRMREHSKNPALPNLRARQKEKEVGKLKSKHTRELLASLGKHLCSKVLRRAPKPVTSQ